MDTNFLTCVSENFFVRITSNNSIKVWSCDDISQTKNVNCELLHSLTEKDHLRFDYSSIAILDDKQNRSILMLGDSQGRIALFCLLKGEKMCEKVLNHGSHLNHIHIHSHLKTKNTINFASSTNHTLHECQLNTDTNTITTLYSQSFTSQTINSFIYHLNTHSTKEKSLITVDNKIQVWQKTLKAQLIQTIETLKSKTLETPKTLQKRFLLSILNGHSCKIDILRLTPDHRYLITAAKDRYLHIWKCKKWYSKSSSSPTILNTSKHSIFMEEDIINIDLHMSSSDKEYLIGIHSKYNVKIWTFDSKNKSLICEISSGSMINNIQFVDEQYLDIFRGSSMIAVGNRIEFSGKSKIELDEISLLSKRKQKDCDLKMKDVMVDDVQVLDIADCAMVNDRKRKIMESDEKVIEPVIKRMKYGSIPRANSMAAVIIQALNANDDQMFLAMMLEVQQMSDDMKSEENDIQIANEVIGNSMAQLSNEMAEKLLEKLCQRLRIWPRKSITILRWLMPLLNTHFVQFANSLRSRKHLISIHQCIDYQIKSILPALQLQGRLSLLTKNIQQEKDGDEDEDGDGMPANASLFKFRF